MTIGRTHVAIGPVTPRASWKWLGPHLAESLADSCIVRFFRADELPQCDVAIFIKECPQNLLRQAEKQACKIIFMPVDRYQSQAQLDADAPFLKQCAGLLVHSKPLGAALARHNPAIWRVDHPNLYGLAEKVPWRPEGYLLWVGDFLNLPYILRWRESVTLPFELKILTNVRRTSIRGLAMTSARAHKLGIRLDVKPDRVNGLQMIEWGFATQQAMMSGCKASLDIKGGIENFNQYTKPPTKAQQFIVSGIPYATNASSPVNTYLLESGFDVADIEEQDHWFSHEYWQYTRAFSEVIEKSTQPQSVALIYRRCLTEVVEHGAAVTIPSPAQPKPAPAGNDNRPPRLYAHLQAAEQHRKLGSAWADIAPHSVLRLLDILRTYVPGFVQCRVENPIETHRKTTVSVLADLPIRDWGDPPGGLQAAIPDNYEIIAFGRSTLANVSDANLKLIRRWPSRGLIRDRVLASAYACGDWLAFISYPGADEMAWLSEAVAALQDNPNTAMVLREKADDDDIDAAASFIVRRDLWCSLKGYSPNYLNLPPACADFDLRQRLRLLGYRVAPGDQHLDTPSPSFQIGDKAVVYTAITNCYDRPLPLKKRCVGAAAQVAFLDEVTRAATISPGNWEIRNMEQNTPGKEQGSDPNRQAKLYKIQPELYFPEARYSMWIDANVNLVYPFDFEQLVDRFLSDADLCVFRHHARSCIYQEAEACKVRRLDSEPLIDQQVTRYRQEGFPPRRGLNEAVVILRRHSDAVKNFNQQWWQEICLGSRRDQLSFNYIQWKTGLPIAEFPLSILENNGLFYKTAHLRRPPISVALKYYLWTTIHRMEAYHFDLSALVKPSHSGPGGT
jgi:hypothetical protein